MGDNQDPDHLSEILKAAGDPTRRSLLTSLAQEGPTRVTDLADRYELSLNAVSKHIKVLEKAGLVTRRTMGRTHLIEIDLGPLHVADGWFKDLRSIWELRLERLAEALAQGDKSDE